MKSKLKLAKKTHQLKVSLCFLGLLGIGVQVQAETITVGGFNFTEATILSNVYANALKKGGVTVKTRLNLGNREIVLPALRSGEIDVVPEYPGALLNYYQPNATATSLKQVNAELSKLIPNNLALLNSSSANSITAWAVRQETAKKYNLKKLSDLTPIAPQLIIGGPPEFPKRSLGLPGLNKVYGLKFKEVKVLDMGGPLVRMALNSGKIDVGTVISTQGNIAKEKWVILADDKHQQPDQNITPLIRKAVLTPKVTKILNEVSSKLTTPVLISLNQQVDVQRKDPNTVAREWVEANISAK